MDCGWPLYRQNYAGTFRYLCGKYQQTHGKACNHNAIDGVQATRFVLGTINQRLLNPHTFDRIKAKLIARASTERTPKQPGSILQKLKSRLGEVNRLLTVSERNLAFAENKEDLTAISKVRSELTAEKLQLESKIESLEAATRPDRSAVAEVDKALELLNSLSELARDASDFVRVSDLFQRVDVRLFCRFIGVQKKKRIVNQLAGGLITFGDTAPPIHLYTGKTDRRSALAAVEAASGTVPDAGLAQNLGQTGEESKSLGNVNRGETTRAELFRASILHCTTADIAVLLGFLSRFGC